MSPAKLSLKARALRYLSLREHSRLELERKLARYAEEGDDINVVLDWLQSANFLSESRFAESLVNRRSARFGNSRILSELHGHQIDEQTVSGLKRDLLKNEAERAWQVWERKYGVPADSAAESARQMRFLQQRGFSFDAIQSVMRRVSRDKS